MIRFNLLTLSYQHSPQRYHPGASHEVPTNRYWNIDGIGRKTVPSSNNIGHKQLTRVPRPLLIEVLKHWSSMYSVHRLDVTMELSFRDFAQRYDRPIFQLSGSGAPMPIKGLRPRQLEPPESFEDVHERRWLSDAPGFIYSGRRGTRTLSVSGSTSAIRQVGHAAKPVMASARSKMVIPKI